jgi:Na+-transporting NADH:ubiquinone oxidoreductase subunit A
LFSFLRPGFTADSYSKSTIAEYIPFLPKKLETNIHGGIRPCVQCNYCDEVCPVDIYPFLIWKYGEVNEVEESFRLRPFDCIECGLCNYVCPSKIDILSSVRKAKEEYHRSGRTDDISD